jgi:hypothetical protein
MEMQNAVLKLLYDGHKIVNKSTLHLLCVQWDNLVNIFVGYVLVPQLPQILEAFQLIVL